MLEGENVAGIIDESDILMTVYGHEERFGSGSAAR